MKRINSATKINTLLKINPGALDSLFSISHKFEKLRNPLIRKLMAGRASIEMAAIVDGVAVSDFFDKLKPLGFMASKKRKNNKQPEYDRK